MAEDRWVSLFVISRIGGTALAVLLLTVHRVTDHDLLLSILAIAYGTGSVAAVARVPRIGTLPAVWIADAGIAFGLVVVSGQWRSPFYVLALTALVLPATRLRFRAALVAGALFTGVYFIAALVVGLDFDELGRGIRLESLATHLMMPPLVTLALAYATELLRERERGERLGLEAERRRIGLELHDSAKQRLHAAHLLVSSLEGRLAEGPERDSVTQAQRELRAAVTDMETSVSELRTPLLEHSLDEALRARARELADAAGVRIVVQGRAGELPASVETHAFRVASEAITNALRHAKARQVEVRLAAADGVLELSVLDDGCGMPSDTRPASQGLHSMTARAESLGGRLAVRPGPQGAGTEVRLLVPLEVDGSQ